MPGVDVCAVPVSAWNPGHRSGASVTATEVTATTPETGPGRLREPLLASVDALVAGLRQPSLSVPPPDLAEARPAFWNPRPDRPTRHRSAARSLPTLLLLPGPLEHRSAPQRVRESELPDQPNRSRCDRLSPQTSTCAGHEPPLDASLEHLRPGLLDDLFRRRDRPVEPRQRSPRALPMNLYSVSTCRAPGDGRTHLPAEAGSCLACGDPALPEEARDRRFALEAHAAGCRRPHEEETMTDFVRHLGAATRNGVCRRGHCLSCRVI